MKKLISMVATPGKTPDQVATELFATVRRYQEETAAGDGDSEDPKSSADPEAGDGSE